MPNKQRKSTENLKPWKKGESGNPKGRPRKADCLTSLLKEEMARIDPDDEVGRTWAELLVIATMRLAIAGNGVALKEVWERVDGKVKDRLQMDDPGPVTIRVVYVDAQDKIEPNTLIPA